MVRNFKNSAIYASGDVHASINGLNISQELSPDYAYRMTGNGIYAFNGAELDISNSTITACNKGIYGLSSIPGI